MLIRSALFVLALLSMTVVDAAVPAGPLIPVKQGAKWGVVDPNGRTIIPFEYDRVLQTDSGYLDLQTGDLHGLADAGGRIILPVKYMSLGLSFDRNGLMEARTTNGYEGLVDRSNVMRVPPVFGWVSAFDDHDLYVVRFNGAVGIISLAKQNWFVRPTFSYIDKLAKNGLALAKTRDGKTGFIDAAAHWVIPPDQVQDAFAFDDGGLAPAKKDDRWGFIDSSGRWVIPPVSSEPILPGFAVNGLAAVTIAGKRGYIDRAGKIAIPARFDEATIFGSDGLADVKVGEKWGMIDATGRFVIPARYDGVIFSRNGIGVVTVGKHSWFVDRNGRKILGNFDEVGPFEHGWAPVKVHGKWGAIDPRGKWLLQPVYACVNLCLDEPPPPIMVTTTPD